MPDEPTPISAEQVQHLANLARIALTPAEIEHLAVELGSIVDSVRKVTDLVAEISSASTEQTSGIEEVNHAITHMDNATQQNAALVEQAAAAAQAMQQEAASLSAVVGIFKLKSAARSGAGARQPALIGR